MLSRSYTQCLYKYRRNVCRANTSSNGFPSSDFKAFLTLFSKCFSSFLHSTCSLSVSHQYLALDGIYHPLWSALPSKPTLRKPSEQRTLQPNTGLSPSMAPAFQPDLDISVAWIGFFRLQFPKDFKLELFRVQSPLLTESQLVSFPPLSYMLKFSGSSYLI